MMLVERGWMVPLGAALTGAVAFGLWLGLRSQPPTETAIIEAQAAAYVAHTGGAPTDCAARPAGLEGVRLVVTCGADWAVAVDEWGRRVDLPDIDTEPRT